MWKQFFSGLGELIYPSQCLVCKKSLKRTASQDKLVCSSCWASIKRNIPPFCHSCGRHLGKTSVAKHICPLCMRASYHFDRAFSPCNYDGVLKELIHIFKYRNKDYLGKPLSALMIEFIKEYHLPMEYIDTIVPVPLHSARLREREFNQAQVLCRHIAEEFNKPVLPDALKRHRYTRTQTDLPGHERLANVKGSFSVAHHDGVKDKNILLVDDVLTTGATASEAAYELKKAGANIVFTLTLAN